MTESNKFICEQCTVTFQYKSKYEAHLRSKGHTGEPKKTRSDKKYDAKCKIEGCNFVGAQFTSMETHILTKHGTPQERENRFKYYCKCCDFGTMGEIIWKRHQETQKHQGRQVGVLNV
jgi:hypothetical protein